MALNGTLNSHGHGPRLFQEYCSDRGKVRVLVVYQQLSCGILHPRSLCARFPSNLFSIVILSVVYLKQGPDESVGTPFLNLDVENEAFKHLSKAVRVRSGTEVLTSSIALTEARILSPLTCFTSSRMDSKCTYTAIDDLF